MLQPERPQRVAGLALRDLVAGISKPQERLGGWGRGFGKVDRRVGGLVALEEAEHPGRIIVGAR